MSDKPRRKRSRPPIDTSDPASARLPVVSRQKKNELKSRQLFESAVFPWLFQDSRHDNGIDGEVEITRQLEGESHEATGKRFLVQLKSTDGRLARGKPVPARIRPMHVRYWSESNLPVLLARCHLPTGRFFWSWVDESFVATLSQRDPAWMAKDSLTVHLPFESTLDSAALSAIESYVIRHRNTARRILDPGRYHALQAQALRVSSRLDALAVQAQLTHVQRRLADLRQSLSGCTYIVALTGPARAGKSTLLNALLGKDVSPVDRFPTTAVPIIVVGGASDGAEVIFADGTVRTGPATASFLADFATQDRNPDNTLGVRLVTVRMVSEALDRGLAFTDSPGLHDPSEPMRKIAELALDSASAVIYVLDVSPARNGGFSLNAQTISDLKRFRSQADRLLIILNKADDLDSACREATRQFVARELQKYALWEDLPTEPIFLSAKAAWEWNRSDSTNPLQELQEALWGHLLRTKSTGIDRLTFSVMELTRAGQDMLALLAARGADAERAAHIHAALSSCRKQRDTIVARCRRQQTTESRALSGFLASQKVAAMSAIEGWLGSIPSQQPLPSEDALRGHLQKQLINVLGSAWNEANARAQSFSQEIAADVERCLERSRAAAGTAQQVRFVVPALQNLGALSNEPYSEAWTGLAIGGLLALILQAPVGLLLAVAGWIIGHTVGQEPRRKREIARIMGLVEKATTSGLSSVRNQVIDRVYTHIKQVELRALDRIDLFVENAESQLRPLGRTSGLATREAIESIALEVAEVLREIGDIAVELGSTATGEPTQASAPMQSDSASNV